MFEIIVAQVFVQRQFTPGLSHSRYWKEMAAFVVEDETQDGPDHVDVHRAPVFIASPMWPAFQSKADLRSFTARPADVDLDHGSEKSGEMRLEVADSADDREYNEIIWKAVRGEASPLPPRKVGAFVKSRD